MQQWPGGVPCLIHWSHGAIAANTVWTLFIHLLFGELGLIWLRPLYLCIYLSIISILLFEILINLSRILPRVLILVSGSGHPQSVPGCLSCCQHWCHDTVKSLGKLQSVRVDSGVLSSVIEEIVSDVIMVSQSDFRGGCHVWWALRDRGDLLSRSGHFDRRSWHSNYVSSWDKNQRSEEGVCRFLPRSSQGSTLI